MHRYLLYQALPWPEGPPRIALLLDEVEGAGKARDVNGEPFSDSFFMMLRGLYKQYDDKGVLVVALAGSVNPGDLVKDPDISPFNVGQEIGLNDFTKEETRTLTEQLANLALPVEQAVHQTIYEWTNGHPYLTQRICAELEKIAHRGQITTITPSQVTRIVEEVILNPVNPLQRDKNLKHVTKMLHNLSPPVAQLWSQLRAGEAIHASYGLDLELYLTGAVKNQGGRLVIRNRIYERAFLHTHLPTETAKDAIPAFKPPPGIQIQVNVQNQNTNIGGNQIDASESQGFINKPAGSVRQKFGD